MFFLIDSLKSVNLMYRFSLPTFLRLFCTNLEESVTASGSVMTAAASTVSPPPTARRMSSRSMAPSVEMSPIRMAALVQQLKVIVFGYVTRSLFKADRLMFALHFAHTLHPRMVT